MLLKLLWVVWGVNALHFFKRYGWQSWRAWVVNAGSFIVLYWWIGGVFSTPEISLREILPTSQDAQIQSGVNSDAQSPDGVYLLNGNNRSATITVVGDTWYFESTSSFSEPEFGSISSGGRLSNSEGFPRGDLFTSLNKISYLGYSFYKR